MKNNSVLQKAGLVIISILLSAFSAEMILRIVYPQQTKYFIWQPNLHHTFTPDSAIMPGLQSPAKFTVNSYGLRTNAEQMKLETSLFDEPGKQEKLSGNKYYMCLGGSTTECLYLDDSKTWPAQLRDLALKRSLPWFVYNAGKSGCTTRENYIQLKYCVPQYRKFHAIIMMVGLNDLIKRLSRDTLFDSDFQFTRALEDSFVNTIFLKQGRGIGKTWLRRTALFYLVQQASHQANHVNWEMQDDKGEVYKLWRENRAHASVIVDTLPDLTSALKEFSRNLNLMIDEAQKQNLEIIFVNQSALWKDSMNAEELRLLWMGGIGNFQEEKEHPYYSAKALRQGLNLYNKMIAEVCAERKVLLIDIDSKLPHDVSTFYDDCHFTIEGAKKTGEIIIEGLTKNTNP